MKRAQKVSGLIAGVAFGVILSWAQVTDWEAIRAMLRFADPYLFFMMGSGMAVGFVGVRLLRRFGVRARFADGAVSWKTSKPTPASVAGAAIFGLGWALSGNCPGPATAQLGEGKLAALFTVAGILMGVAAKDLLARARAAPAIAGARST